MGDSVQQTSAAGTDMLEEDEQLLLVLSYGQGMTNEEIADMLQTPSGSVKSKIHRAKNKIRKHFDLGGSQ